MVSKLLISFLVIYFLIHFLWVKFGKIILYINNEYFILKKSVFYFVFKSIKIKRNEIRNVELLNNINSGYHFSFSGLRFQLKHNFGVKLELLNSKNIIFESESLCLSNEIYRELTPLGKVKNNKR